MLFLFALMLSVSTLTTSVHAQASLDVAPAQTDETQSEVIKPLLDVLKDETAREKLIQSLEQSAPGDKNVPRKL